MIYISALFIELSDDLDYIEIALNFSYTRKVWFQGFKGIGY